MDAQAKREALAIRYAEGLGVGNYICDSWFGILSEIRTIAEEEGLPHNDVRDQVRARAQEILDERIVADRSRREDWDCHWCDRVNLPDVSSCLTCGHSKYDGVEYGG